MTILLLFTFSYTLCKRHSSQQFFSHPNCIN